MGGTEEKEIEKKIKKEKRIRIKKYKKYIFFK